MDFFISEVRNEVFGIVHESNSEQFNYLFQEPSESYASAVIYMAHNYLENEVSKMRILGSKQNNDMASYMKSRVAPDRYKSMIIQFILKRYFRFSVDAVSGSKRTILKKYDVHLKVPRVYFV